MVIVVYHKNLTEKFRLNKVKAFQVAQGATALCWTACDNRTFFYALEEGELLAIREDDTVPITVVSRNDLQQLKVGHWEFVQYDYNPDIGNWHCSECRYIAVECAEEKYGGPKYNYCPKCGAKMESEEAKDDPENL